MQSGIMSKPNRSLVAHWKNGRHEEQTHLHREDLILLPLRVFWKLPLGIVAVLHRETQKGPVPRKGCCALLAAALPLATHASVMASSSEHGGGVEEVGPQTPGREAFSVKRNRIHGFFSILRLFIALHNPEWRHCAANSDKMAAYCLKRTVF